MNGKMRIGELAERARVTCRTIRYYESLGLLGSSEREGAGFHYYMEAHLARLRKIDMLKRLGLTLEEIRNVLELYFTESTMIQGNQKLLEILQTHLKETKEKRQALEQFELELQANIVKIQNSMQESFVKADVS